MREYDGLRDPREQNKTKGADTRFGRAGGRVTKKRQNKNDSTSSEIGWSGSGDGGKGRSGSWNWDGVWGVHHWDVAEPIARTENVPILYYGVCIDGSDCIVCVDDGLFDLVHVLRNEARVGKSTYFVAWETMHECWETG